MPDHRSDHDDTTRPEPEPDQPAEPRDLSALAWLFGGLPPTAIDPGTPQVPFSELLQFFAPEAAPAPAPAPEAAPRRPRRRRMMDQLQTARLLMRDLEREQLIMLNSEIADKLAGKRPRPN